MMKKVAIIGSVGMPAKYGGFETLVEQLAIRLQARFELTVYCAKPSFPAPRPKRIGKVNLRYIPLHANGKQSIIYDIWSIFSAIRYADTLLILGVGGCVILPFLRFFGCRKRILVNIDGIEWRRDKWSGTARRYLHFAERCAVKYADTVIADNQVIVEYVRLTYHCDCKLIEYGADNGSIS